MKQVFKDIAKSGTLFFVVGVLLALAAPPLARLLGPDLLGQAAFSHALSTPVMWTGAFFGAFGAIDAAVKPVINWVFNDKNKDGAEQARSVSKEKSDTPQVNITIQQSPQLAQEPHMADSKYRAQIAEERVALGGNERV